MCFQALVLYIFYCKILSRSFKTYAEVIKSQCILKTNGLINILYQKVTFKLIFYSWKKPVILGKNIDN
jgi:hypothetical protein